MNFVVAYCVMISTNQIAYFKRLLRSKGQSFQNTFRGIKDKVDGSIKLALNTISNAEISDPLCK